MKITFHGAAGEVTGSCHLLEVGDHRILLDCGLIQGGRQAEARNAEPFPFDAAAIDAVILGHAHLDHSGRLPLLVKAGFKGPIYTQHATRDLARVMLRDAAFLQEKDAEINSRKRARKGQGPVTPLYDKTDATTASRRMHGLDYETPEEILPGVTVTLREAGHILGSAVVDLNLTEGGETRRLIYSGDLGHHDAPILRDPAVIDTADLVVMESTYGNRCHRSWEETWNELADILEHARHERGNVLIPAFTVGRTQELLYVFGQNYDTWDMGRWQIFLDSPMGIEATEIYTRHWRLYDEEALGTRQGNGGSIFQLPNLHFSHTAKQSQAINRLNSGALVIAGSGMCTGGRILHHFKHNLWRRETDVIIVGFQARGTLGRALVDGAEEVRLWGETVRVGARVHTVGGLSAHADQAGLTRWYEAIAHRPPVVLVHGESEARAALGEHLRETTGATVMEPDEGQSIDLLRPDRLLDA